MSWQSALERTVAGLGYDLVDVERCAGALLRVTIDRQPGRLYSTGPGNFVLVEDCEIVNRQLQYLLEVEAVDYQRLEVSSPGLDRPLKRPADWQRFAGELVDVTLREPFRSRRRWRGVLAEGGDASAWRLLLADDRASATGRGPKHRAARPAARPAPAEPPAQVLDFSLDEVREARLVPVVDFKGRRLQPPGAGAAVQGDGGQDE